MGPGVEAFAFYPCTADYICEFKVSLIYTGLRKRRRIWGFCHQALCCSITILFFLDLFFPTLIPPIYQSSSDNPVFVFCETFFWGLERWLWLPPSCCVPGLCSPCTGANHIPDLFLPSLCLCTSQRVYVVVLIG